MTHHGITRRAKAGCLVMATLVVPAWLGAQSPQRAIYVSVVDRAGNLVPGLGAADFVVREDGVTREVIKVEPASDPMHIALLIDNSQAAERFQRDYREAVTAFITAISAEAPAAGKHQIALISLASRPTILS